LDAITHKIEVKATVNKIDDASKESVEFYMSKTQYSKAQKYGRDTHLIFVTGVESDNPQFLYMNFDNNWLNDFETLDVDNPDIMMINNLMWQKETVKKKMNWNDAMEYAKNLRLGGHNDWRLPSIDEFGEVIDSCGIIHINRDNNNWDSITNENMNNNYYQNSYKEKGFSYEYYWSSTTYKNDSNNAWIVLFYNGNVGYYRKNDSNFVRCVRAGE